MPGGRPLKFNSVEELSDTIQEYYDTFAEGGKRHGRPQTISGLAFALDVCTQTLLNYEEKDEFFATIKRAKQLVEIDYEENLHGNNSTGSIFALKNFNWKDSQNLNLGGQKDNQLPTNCDARILELLNKGREGGAIEASGEQETSGDKE